ncbi:MAG: acyl-CoA thioesterase II [Lysobacterales bacterium]|jgi:acyl-CoA thioesterase-2
MKQSESFQELLHLMQLEQLEVNLFRGASRDIGTERVFGGQVLAQALLAASYTIEDRLVHSLHAYFLRAGDHNAPIVYNVDRSRDGRSFSARRVVAIQHGRPIFTLSASFQVEEQGLEHQFDAPDVPEPDSLQPIGTVARDDLDQLPKNIQRWLDRFGPFEFRPVQRVNSGDRTPRPPYREIWFRLHGELEDDPRLRRALLAYVSDFQLVGTATLPHGISWTQPDLILASLDHAMWFHRDFRLDDWLLYSCDSPSASSGRGFARGMIYDRRGRLVASTAQEGVIRLRRESD